MTTRATDRPTRKRKTYVRDLGKGLKLRAEISPCVFMYTGYPLQLSVTLLAPTGQALGTGYAVDRTSKADTYTDASVTRLLAAVRIIPCPQCSTPAFDPATIKTNRGGLCEVCFLQGLKSEWAAEAEAEQRRIALRDRRMKGNGMVVRLTAWVHPRTGGDDYQVDWYLASRPKPAEVRNLLRKEGSSQLDDFQIITL